MQGGENRHIISALVTNESGVLTRISGLFARRCYNIDSLTTCATEHAELSRMTITVRGDDSYIKQMILQLGKLPVCRNVCELDGGDAVMRELLLIKIRAGADKRPEIETVCRTYEAKIVDMSPDSIAIELTGKPNKLDGLIDVLKEYGILELARTGLTALSRGSDVLKDDTNKTVFF